MKTNSMNSKKAQRIARRRKQRARRVLLTVVLMALTAAISIGGTMAYLKDTTTEITNQFTSSEVRVTLAESTGLDFKMIPGEKIKKDPKVTVTNDVDAYVFVKVTKEGDPDKYLTYTIDSAWTLLEEGVYYKEVAKDADPKTFSVLTGDVVTVENDLSNADMDTAKNTPPKLIFQAYAVQKAGMTSVAAAWTEAQTATDI